MGKISIIKYLYFAKIITNSILKIKDKVASCYNTIRYGMMFIIAE